jgi:hypothetical protein
MILPGGLGRHLIAQSPNACRWATELALVHVHRHSEIYVTDFGSYEEAVDVGAAINSDHILPGRMRLR